MQEINFHPLYTSLLHVDEIDTVIHVDCSFVNKRKTLSKNNIAMYIGCSEDSKEALLLLILTCKCECSS